VVIVVLQWLVVKLTAWLAPGTIEQFQVMFIAPMAAIAAVGAWWLFASRLPWGDRLLVIAACALGAVGMYFLHSPDFHAMGIILYALPAVTTVWVGSLVLTFFLRWPVRRAVLMIALILTWSVFTLLRMEGVNGTMATTFRWRWTPTAEERFLAERAANGPMHAVNAKMAASEVLLLQPGDWPGFRGPDRDGRLKGVRIVTDWQHHPPRELWRHRVGPGWGSFAAVGNRLFTQEQRGQDEAVVCYDATSGAEYWVYLDAARFSELVAGPGPRATPTFDDGKIYALGASGRLNCLDAATGRVHWSRDIVADSGAKVPQWGFAASPLVASGIVTVFAGGPEGKSVLGYHTASGDLAWAKGEGQLSYSSPQLAQLNGVQQILIATDAGLTAFEPARGDILWRHEWQTESLARIVQPALIGDADVLVGTGMRIGTRRLHVDRAGGGWKQEELWTSLAIKPYFNDLVIHDGHLYGFTSDFLTCVELTKGKKRWAERGYGNGQVLLLADQGVLLVLSEEGEVALVKATPEGREELGRFQALHAKTWNHPVVAHGRLFVRNGEEAACYQLEPLSN